MNKKQEKKQKRPKTYTYQEYLKKFRPKSLPPIEDDVPFMFPQPIKRPMR